MKKRFLEHASKDGYVASSENFDTPFTYCSHGDDTNYRIQDEQLACLSKILAPCFDSLDFVVLRDLFSSKTNSDSALNHTCCLVELEILHGGFSGSRVLRAERYGIDGSLGLPLVIKMDRGDVIREESRKHETLQKYLKQHCPRIRAVSIVKDRGGMLIDLVGACWELPSMRDLMSADCYSTLKSRYEYEMKRFVRKARREDKLFSLERPAHRRSASNSIRRVASERQKNEFEGTPPPFGSVYTTIREVFREVLMNVTLGEERTLSGSVRLFSDIYDVPTLIQQKVLCDDDVNVKRVLSSFSDRHCIHTCSCSLSKLSPRIFFECFQELTYDFTHNEEYGVYPVRSSLIIFTIHTSISTLTRTHIGRYLSRANARRS